MNPADQNRDDGILDEAAAEWLVERDEGFAPGRAEAFAAWCARDSRHAEALMRLERTLALLDELPEVKGSQARVASVRPASAANPGFGVQRLVWTAGLAAVLVLGFSLWWVSTPRQPAGQHYVTDAVAQRSLVLPDGSVLDINTASDVVVQFTAGERRVILGRGEAHFQVARDAARPFIVTAGGVAVRAVGTAFNVRLAAEGVDVIVVEGKVELDRGEATTLPPSRGNAPLLVAGERAQLSGSDRISAPTIEKIDSTSIRALLTWQNPLTNFADVPLRDVVARFNRRNSTQLTLADAALGDRRIGGMIALDQVDAFVRMLEQDGDIVAVRHGSAEITLRRAR